MRLHSVHKAKDLFVLFFILKANYDRIICVLPDKNVYCWERDAYGKNIDYRR